jgi:hypothetical protein
MALSLQERISIEREREEHGAFSPDSQKLIIESWGLDPAKIKARDEAEWKKLLEKVKEAVNRDDLSIEYFFACALMGIS